MQAEAEKDFARALDKIVRQITSRHKAEKQRYLSIHLELRPYNAIVFNFDQNLMFFKLTSIIIGL